MYRDCKSYKIVREMLKSKSGQDLLSHYERPSKELLERFMANQTRFWSWFIFMNVFMYSYDDRSKYKDIMNDYTLNDIAFFLSASQQFYDDIRVVLEHLIKYDLLSEEDKAIVLRILARNIEEEIY